MNNFEIRPVPQPEEQALLEADRPLGLKAEDVAINFLAEHFPNISIRHATEREDSGVKQIERGKQIDAVVYVGEKPAMAIQITTARDKAVRNEKMAQLRDRPFVRLDEMKPQDPSIPKVLVGLSPENVELFLSDNDYAKHPEILDEIMLGITNSLNFDLLISKNPADKERIKQLLEIFK
jgi:hypothetical protein